MRSVLLQKKKVISSKIFSYFFSSLLSQFYFLWDQFLLLKPQYNKTTNSKFQKENQHTTDEPGSFP